MNPAVAALLAVAGAALLTYAVLLRIGARSWASGWTDGGEAGARGALLTTPSGGAGLLALAVVDRADKNTAAALIVAICLPIFLVLGVPAALRLRVPLWLVPSWARESYAQRRRARAGRRR
jgi:hypothetical protein